MNVGKIIRTVGEDIWGGIKKFVFIVGVVVGAVSVLMSVLTFFGSEFIGVPMIPVYVMAAIALALFYGYILREVAKEWNIAYSLNVKHLFVVLITFVFFFVMATACVGAVMVIDVWWQEKLTLAQIWERYSLYENFSLYMSILAGILFFSTPLMAYIASVYERIKEEK